MRSQVILLASFLTVLTISCSSIYDISYDYDKQTNFAGLKTYYWSAVPKEAKIDALLQERIKSAIITELAAKGLKLSPDDPDFLIAMQTMKKEKVSYSPQSAGYIYGPYWYGPKYSQYTYEEGTLVLDFVDTVSKKLIWRGTAKGLVDYNMTPAKLDNLVDEAVHKMFENFPPPSPR